MKSAVFLLGIQVAYFILIGLLASLAALLGYQVADGAFNALDRGSKWRGAIQFWCGIALCCGLTILVLWGGLRLGISWWWPWLL